MKSRARELALCGMLTALGVVIMILGAAIGIGTYAVPLYAALCLLPIRQLCRPSRQVLVWMATGALSLILVPDVLQTLYYIGVFGAYPLLFPWFQRLPRILGTLGKFLYFHAVVLGLELLGLWVLAPEAMELWFGAILLVMGNLVFWCYDRILPRLERWMTRQVQRFWK